MALGDLYASLADLKGRLGVADTDDDTRLTAALTAASVGIEKFCRRQFNDAESASARTYRPTHHRLTLVADFHSTVALVVETDDADDGTFGTTWTGSDYQLEPLDGVMDGVSGWPFWRVRAVDAQTFPRGRRATVRVTARWGWAAVPGPVKEATLIIAEEIFKLKDAPFGVAGFADFGAVRVRQNPIASGMVAPYRRDAVLVG